MTKGDNKIPSQRNKYRKHGKFKLKNNNLVCQ